MVKNVDIDQRTLIFAVKILKFIETLPNSIAGKVIANQISRSATSIGANIQEALGAHTKVDYIYKMNIAKSEARETKYWLRLIEELNCSESKILQPLLVESDELVAILTTIVKNSKSKN